MIAGALHALLLALYLAAFPAISRRVKRNQRWAARRYTLAVDRVARIHEDAAYAQARAAVPNHPVSLPVRRTP